MTSTKKDFFNVIRSLSSTLEDKTTTLYNLIKKHNISDDICLYLCKKIVHIEKQSYTDDTTIYLTLIMDYTHGGISYELYPQTNEYIMSLFHEYIIGNYCKRADSTTTAPFEVVNPTILTSVVNRVSKFSYDYQLLLSDDCVFAIISICFPDRNKLDLFHHRQQSQRLSFVGKLLRFVDYSHHKLEVQDDLVPLIDSYISRETLKDNVCSKNRYLSTEEKLEFYDSLIREKNYRKLMNDDHA